MYLSYIIHKIVLQSDQNELIEKKNKEKKCKELCRYLNLYSNYRFNYKNKNCLLDCIVNYKNNK